MASLAIPHTGSWFLVKRRLVWRPYIHPRRLLEQGTVGIPTLRRHHLPSAHCSALIAHPLPVQPENRANTSTTLELLKQHLSALSLNFECHCYDYPRTLCFEELAGSNGVSVVPRFAVHRHADTLISASLRESMKSQQTGTLAFVRKNSTLTPAPRG